MLKLITILLAFCVLSSPAFTVMADSVLAPPAVTTPAAPAQGKCKEYYFNNSEGTKYAAPIPGYGKYDENGNFMTTTPSTEVLKVYKCD